VPADARGDTPKLYGELAAWWPLLSAPADYVEEAAFYQRTLLEASERSCQTLLELGSGGGNNASHLKARFSMVLVDRSPGMLQVSRALNPECEHLEGDMRTVRLGRQFDGVFVHDAVAYMTTETDLRRVIETAYVHCKPGGAALFAPDHVRENFRASTDHGGHDGVNRSLRYLEWTWDPDPADSSYVVDYAYLLREGVDVTGPCMWNGTGTSKDCSRAQTGSTCWLTLVSTPRSCRLTIRSSSRASMRSSYAVGPETGLGKRYGFNHKACR
jgi:SAM-dependent methyltransferase